MQSPKWTSTGLYEHPAKHQAGRYGNIEQSQAGIYVLRVGGSHMSCPQDWAAKIHADETTKSDYIHIRIAPREKIEIEQATKNAGLDTMSAYFLQLHRKAKTK
jgi:hypothetical protein